MVWGFIYIIVTGRFAKKLADALLMETNRPGLSQIFREGLDKPL